MELWTHTKQTRHHWTMMGMMKLHVWDATLCFWAGNSKDDNLEVFVPLCRELLQFRCRPVSSSSAQIQRLRKKKVLVISFKLTWLLIVTRIKVLQNWWAIFCKGRAGPFSGDNHFETQPNVNLIHSHPGVIGKHGTWLVFPKLHETWLESVSLPRTHTNPPFGFRFGTGIVTQQKPRNQMTTKGVPWWSAPESPTYDIQVLLELLRYSFSRVPFIGHWQVDNQKTYVVFTCVYVANLAPSWMPVASEHFSWHFQGKTFWWSLASAWGRPRYTHPSSCNVWESSYQKNKENQHDETQYWRKPHMK